MELKYYQSALILDIAEDGGIAYNVTSGGHDTPYQSNFLSIILSTTY